MKQQVLFIQGGGAGAHREDKKLAESLQKLLGESYDVHFARMPHEENPEYSRWRPRFAKELGALPGTPVLVGHSVGASLLLKYLVEETREKTLAGIFLIATPFWGGKGWRYDGFERVTLPEGFASKLPAESPLFLYHGRDDDVVPFAHLALYAEKLEGAHLRELDGTGHKLDNNMAPVAADIARL